MNVRKRRMRDVGDFINNITILCMCADARLYIRCGPDHLNKPKKFVISRKEMQQGKVFAVSFMLCYNVIFTSKCQLLNGNTDARNKFCRLFCFTVPNMNQN